MNATTRNELLTHLSIIKNKADGDPSLKHFRIIMEVAEAHLRAKEPDEPELVIRAPPSGPLNRSKPDRPVVAWNDFWLAFFVLIAGGSVAVLTMTLVAWWW